MNIRGELKTFSELLPLNLASIISLFSLFILKRCKFRELKLAVHRYTQVGVKIATESNRRERSGEKTLLFHFRARVTGNARKYGSLGRKNELANASRPCTR